MMVVMALFMSVTTKMFAWTGNCKYQYDYKNRLVKKELMKWSERESKWEESLCWNYTYNEDGLTVVELNKWDAQTKSFSQPVNKMVYRHQEGHLLLLEVYIWNKTTKEFVLEKVINA